MPVKLNGKILIDSNYFEVTNEITIKSTESVNKAKSTYDIVLKTKQNEKYDIEINRLKFLVKEKEIVNKFSGLSHLYFESIFPIQFVIVKDTLELSNYKEIQNRISKTDNLLVDKYKGEGFEYIRTSFLKQVEDEKKANQFIGALGFISIVNLILKRYTKENNFDFQWKIPSVGNTFWELKLEDNKNDSVTYLANQVDEGKFLNALNEYRVQNKYDNIEDKELNMERNFLTTIQYEGNNLNVIQANTSCKIKLGKHFEYEENISIKSIL